MRPGGVGVLGAALLGGDGDRLARPGGGAVDLAELDVDSPQVARGDHQQGAGVAAPPGLDRLLQDGDGLVQLVGGVEGDPESHAGERPPPGVPRGRELDRAPSGDHRGHLVAGEQPLDRPARGDRRLDQRGVGRVLDQRQPPRPPRARGRRPRRGPG